MAKVCIIHGTGGHPQENWFPWLKTQIEALGHECEVPQFPTPANQTLEGWFAVLDPRRDDSLEDSILVGHSLGGAFALRMLEVMQFAVRASYFVGTPIGVPPIKNMESDKPFIGRSFDWEAIKRASRRIEVFHSDDDPYVGLGNGEALARNLDGKLNFRPGCGHFNSAAGFSQFSEILEMIKQDLGS